MADDISTKKLDQLVGNIITENFVSFSYNEILSNRRKSKKSLHITVIARGTFCQRSFFYCEPQSFEDAAKEELWIKAMNEEFESIEKNQTSKLVYLP